MCNKDSLTLQTREDMEKVCLSKELCDELGLPGDHPYSVQQVVQALVDAHVVVKTLRNRFTCEEKTAEEMHRDKMATEASLVIGFDHLVSKMVAVPIETTTRKSIDGLIAEHLSGIVERLQAKK